MPAPANPILYRNASLTLDTVEFANAVNRARLVPDAPIVRMKTLVPDGEIVAMDTAAWTFELSGAQIWAAAGISKVINDAYEAGTNIDVVLQPLVGTGKPTATFEIVPKPMPFGGDQGQILNFEEEFAVVGQPTFGTSA